MSDAVLAEFATDVLPSIRPNISSSEAQLLLPEIKHIYNTLSTVSKASLDQDSHLKEKSFETIRTGNSIILITAGLLIFAVLSFVVMAFVLLGGDHGQRPCPMAAAEAAVEDKIDFLAMISHELRTPASSDHFGLGCAGTTSGCENPERVDGTHSSGGK
ncbi:hypothetical protein ACOJBO_08035 [Rhizobium beringeri]